MIEIREGLDMESLAFIYEQPEIQKVGYDDNPAYPVFGENCTYLGCFVHDELVGAYLMVEYSDYEFEVHSLILDRGMYFSRRFCELMFEWVFRHKRILRLTGCVMEDLKTMRNHALKMGFKKEGFRRDALLINGEPKGLHVMGITRKDWENGRDR